MVWETIKSDDEWQRIAELEEADQKLRFEYEQNVSTSADFDEMIEWLFAHSIGLAESCLMGLEANCHSGLTPLEMSKRSDLPPSTIGGRSPRVKTISTALHRLESKHLAKKVREGKTYRYFSTQSGLNDLAYHREEREKMKQQICVNRGLSLQHLLDRRRVIEAEKLMLQYQIGAHRKVRF